jgi:type IV pilus assembly protein PilV
VSICRDSAPYDNNGLPQWACTSTSITDPIVVKIGWSRASTNATVGTLDKATVPSVLLPVTPGSTL